MSANKLMTISISVSMVTNVAHVRTFWYKCKRWGGRGMLLNSNKLRYAIELLNCSPKDYRGLVVGI